MPEHTEPPPLKGFIYHSTFKFSSEEVRIHFQITSGEKLSEEARASIERQMKQALRQIIENHNL